MTDVPPVPMVTMVTTAVSILRLVHTWDFFVCDCDSEIGLCAIYSHFVHTVRCHL